MSEGERSPLGSQAVHEDATTPNLRKGLCVPCAPRRAPPALLSLRRRRPPALPARGALLTVWHCRPHALPPRLPAAPPPRRPAAPPRARPAGRKEEDPQDAGDGSISIAQILSLKERFDRADTDGGGSLDLQEFMDAFGSILNKDGSKSGLRSARAPLSARMPPMLSPRAGAVSRPCSRSRCP